MLWNKVYGAKQPSAGGATLTPEMRRFNRNDSNVPIGTIRYSPVHDELMRRAFTLSPSSAYFAASYSGDLSSTNFLVQSSTSTLSSYLNDGTGVYYNWPFFSGSSNRYNSNTNVNEYRTMSLSHNDGNADHFLSRVLSHHDGKSLITSYSRNTSSSNVYLYLSLLNLDATVIWSCRIAGPYTSTDLILNRVEHNKNTNKVFFSTGITNDTYEIEDPFSLTSAPTSIKKYTFTSSRSGTKNNAFTRVDDSGYIYGSFSYNTGDAKNPSYTTQVCCFNTSNNSRVYEKTASTGSSYEIIESFHSTTDTVFHCSRGAYVTTAPGTFPTTTGAQEIYLNPGSIYSATVMDFIQQHDIFDSVDGSKFQGYAGVSGADNFLEFVLDIEDLPTNGNYGTLAGGLDIQNHSSRTTGFNLSYSNTTELTLSQSTVTPDSSYTLSTTAGSWTSNTLVTPVTTQNIDFEYFTL